MYFWIHSWSYMSKFKKGGHTCHPIWYSNKIWTRLTIKKLLIISYTGTGKTIEAFVILLFLSELLPFYSFTIGISGFNEILLKQLQGEWKKYLLGCIHCAILILISCNSGCQPKVHCFCCCRTTQHQSLRGLCKILIAKGESSTKYNKW